MHTLIYYVFPALIVLILAALWYWTRAARATHKRDVEETRAIADKIRAEQQVRSHLWEPEDFDTEAENFHYDRGDVD